MQKLCLQSNSRQDVFGFAVGCKKVVVRGGLCAAAAVSSLRAPVSPRPPAS
jgi:hypothetical protein